MKVEKLAHEWSLPPVLVLWRSAAFTRRFHCLLSFVLAKPVTTTAFTAGAVAALEVFGPMRGRRFFRLPLLRSATSWGDWYRVVCSTQVDVPTSLSIW